jgi:3-oxoacyl-[acyl-carrier protein] reductase
MNERPMSGKVAMVTGGAQGIGLEIVRRLHREGARVWIGDVNVEAARRAVRQIDQSSERRVAAGHLDVRKPASIGEAFADCVETFGRLDVLVNNAGIVGRGRVEEMDCALWGDVLEVNLTGTFLCSRAAIPYLKAAGGGVILNVSSISARVPGIGLSAYCSAKAGIEVFTRVLAAEVAPYNIRVNAYAPGVTATPMTRGLIEERGEEKLRQISLRRFGEASDIAELALFLCSEKSGWITGAIISIDGGTMIVGKPWEAWPE